MSTHINANKYIYTTQSESLTRRQLQNPVKAVVLRFVRFCVTQHRKPAPSVTQKRVPLAWRRLLRSVNMASAACARFLLQRSTHGFLLSSRTIPSLSRWAGLYLRIITNMIQIFTFSVNAWRVVITSLLSALSLAETSLNSLRNAWTVTGIRDNPVQALSQMLYAGLIRNNIWV